MDQASPRRRVQDYPQIICTERTNTIRLQIPRRVCLHKRTKGIPLRLTIPTQRRVRSPAQLPTTEMRTKKQYLKCWMPATISPGDAKRSIVSSDNKAREAAQIGRIFASYVKGRGCFIGEIVKTNKTEFVVKTRAGNIVKLPYSYALADDGFKFGYAEWDAIASKNDSVDKLP